MFNFKIEHLNLFSQLHAEMKRTVAIIAGPLAGLILYFIATAGGLDVAVCKMILVAIWMAVWWMTEAVDLGVTSLLPLFLLPSLGILKTDDVASEYMDQNIFLFIGGFILAFAMEKWNLHHRIAYRIILFTGNSPLRILAGIMLTSYLISMWISNTATVLMLVAAVTAIIRHEELFHEKIRKKISTAYMIALAYSATIGGMASPVGTPTNMVFIGYWNETYPDSAQISFLQWTVFGIPFSLAMLATGFLMLRFMFFRKSENAALDKTFILKKYQELGTISFEQWAVMIVFNITAILWFTRSPIDFGSFKWVGWETVFEKGFIKDSTVAIFMASLLFLIPSKNERGTFILEWKDVKQLPLRIILLFGGGFALAKGFEVSGLSDYLANQLTFFSDYPLWVIILILAIIVTILSEFASNVATITLMLPVLASLAVAIGIDPVKLMIPATFAASFGFMMPVATAPNTIAYASGYIHVRQMMRTGLIMNLVGIILLTIAMTLFGF